jgi:Protein of unknown function (DUF998)
MIGSVLFVVVFTVDGWLRPGYDSLGMYISELSLGAGGWIQRANFGVLGILFLLFARGVAAEFREGTASKAGPAVLTIIGVSLLASGPFVTDPMGNQTSWHGVLHGIFGALVFSLAPFSTIVCLRRFREDRQRRALQRWTLLASVVIVVSVAAMKVGQTASSIVHPWVGVAQRVALITYLSWVFTFARGLLKDRE